MNVIIYEDNQADRSSLFCHIKKFFKEQSCLVNITEYESGESFLKDMEAPKIKNANIAFLDIYMPGINGIELANKIRESDEDMVIVFITTSRSHALDGYSVDALQYLVKPVEYSNVENILKKCVKLFADSLGFIEVISKKILIKILLKDILYIEVFGNDCLIHTLSETVRSRITLDEIQKGLDKSMFLRTHRSCVVNMRHIQNVEENDFLLTNGAVVPIRKSDGLAVKQAYMDYVFARVRGI